MKYFVFIIILLALSAVFFIGQEPGPREYVVAVRFMPDRIRPDEIKTNIEYYVASQMFYPLVSIDSSNNLTSHFLDMEKTKSKNQSFKQFILCLKDGVEFSNGEKIKVEHIQDIVNRLGKRSKHLEEVQISENEKSCLFVNLKKSDPSFFHKLSNINSTPLLYSNPDYPIGLGPYKIEKIDSNEIILSQTKGQPVSHFKMIKFVLEKNLKNANYAFIDNNYLPNQKQRHVKNPGMAYISRPSQKTYAFVVNHQDSSLSKLFASCFPRKEFADLQVMDLVQIPGFLPNGLVGSDILFEKALPKILGFDSCKTQNTTPLRVLHYEDSNADEVKSFFSKYQSLLPIPVIFQKVSAAEAIKATFTENNIAAFVGFDSIGLDAYWELDVMNYFRAFISPDRDKRLVTKVNQRLRSFYNLAFTEASQYDLKKRVEEAHFELLSSGQVIPLGEMEITYEYPIALENIYWLGQGGGISGFPDVSRLEWSPSLVERFFK